MTFSYKTLQILTKLYGLGVPYKLTLESLASQPYFQIQNSCQNTTKVKSLLKTNFYCQSTQELLYQIWYGLLLLKTSSIPITEIKRDILIRNNISTLSQIDLTNKEVLFDNISQYSNIELQNCLINHHITICITQTISHGSGPLEILYGIQRELEFLGISLNEFFLGIKLKKWKNKKRKQITHSELLNQRVESVHFRSSKRSVLSAVNPLKENTKEIGDLTSNNDNPNAYFGPQTQLITKWHKLLLNFVASGYFVQYETNSVKQKLLSNLDLETLPISIQLSETTAEDILLYIPFYSKLPYYKTSPFKFIKENINCEDLFRILLIVQETFSIEETEVCFYQLKKRNWDDFLRIVVSYVQTRYPWLLLEVFYSLLNTPTSLPILPEKTKKVMGPTGIWRSITTYQKLRKQYVSAYRMLETLEEKIELEKAFESIATQLQYNIRQSIYSFFAKRYKSTLLTTANQQRISDTELENFFLQKTLKKYLSDMV